MTQRTLTGRCHCGAVQFAAEADPEAGTFRCNCSICARTRMWLVFTPLSGFRLTAGEQHLTDYRFGAERIRHRFCAMCGVKPFGMTDDGVALNVACLDGLAPDDLAALPVTYLDGARDCFDAPPSVTAYL